MRFLITGIGGFAGSYLAEHVLDHGHELFGLVRARRRRPVLEDLQEKYFPAFSLERVVECDIRDRAAVQEVVRDVHPDGLFHLAALTVIPSSYEDPTLTYQVNFHGTLALFEAVSRCASRCRILYVSSADIYGLVAAADQPVTEKCQLRPLTPYGVSKAVADLAAFQWSHSHGLDIVRVRPFNHTGPRQTPAFVCADFARQIAQAEAGQREPLVTVGNLEAVRDFTDVRDVVRGYWLSWEKGEKGEAYNICSGSGWTVKEILRALLDCSSVKIRIVPDPAKLRMSENPVLVGSYAKLERRTGWRPQIPFRTTLADLLAYWRTTVTTES